MATTKTSKKAAGTTPKKKTKRVRMAGPALIEGGFEMLVQAGRWISRSLAHSFPGSPKDERDGLIREEVLAELRVMMEGKLVCSHGSCGEQRLRDRLFHRMIAEETAKRVGQLRQLLDPHEQWAIQVFVLGPDFWKLTVQPEKESRKYDISSLSKLFESSEASSDENGATLRGRWFGRMVHVDFLYATVSEETVTTLLKNGGVRKPVRGPVLLN